jgi:hypothetical protein
MIRIYTAGLLALALAGPALAQGKKDPKGKTELVDAEDALKPGQLVGKVMQATETAMLVRVEHTHVEVDEKALQNALQKQRNPQVNRNQVQQILRQQQQMRQMRERLARARNPQEQMRAMQEIQRQMAQQAQKQQYDMLRKLQQQAGKGPAKPANLLKEVKEYKDFNVELDDGVAYRTSFVPFAYDEMGNPKKYTPQELQALKGNTNQPGYKASATDVKAGQKVTVTLSKNQATEGKLRGTLVLITEESNEPVKGGKGKK